MAEWIIGGGSTLLLVHFFWCMMFPLGYRNEMHFHRWQKHRKTRRH